MTRLILPASNDDQRFWPTLIQFPEIYPLNHRSSCPLNSQYSLYIGKVQRFIKLYTSLPLLRWVVGLPFNGQPAANFSSSMIIIFYYIIHGIIFVLYSTT